MMIMYDQIDLQEPASNIRSFLENLILSIGNDGTLMASINSELSGSCPTLFGSR